MGACIILISNRALLGYYIALPIPLWWPCGGLLPAGTDPQSHLDSPTLSLFAGPPREELLAVAHLAGRVLFLEAHIGNRQRATQGHHRATPGE